MAITVMTSAQLATFATAIAANTATLSSGPFSGTQIKNVPHTADGAVEVAKWYALATSPVWTVWRSDVLLFEVYNLTPFDTDGTTVLSWDWNTYKAQSITEQGAWNSMFNSNRAGDGDGRMGNFGALNNRQGALKIFGTTSAGNAQRAQIFGVSRRAATNLEKIFSVEITGAPANTGNDNVHANRGTATNPDQLVVVGGASTLDVMNAWGI